jgi:hypothetical protein
MTPHQRDISHTLQLLLRIALNPEQSPSEGIYTPVAWSEVYRVSQAQGVAAIAWDGLQRLMSEGLIGEGCNIERHIKLQWALAVENTERRYNKQAKTIAQLTKIYDEVGIKMMILKGYGLSRCYPRPEHRSCSDIDIWLFGEQKRADEILRTKHNIAIDEGEHHHTVFYIDGVMVENHYDFLNIHAHHSSRPIERYLKEQAERSNERVDIDGVMVYLPAVDCHALFLLRHAASHFAATEIMLRHILDWGLFVRAYHNNIDWDRLRSICREQHMEQLLDAINAISAEVCGLDISLMPNTTRRTELERRILGDILHPEFSLTKPERGLLRIVIFKFRRWWANRWKHRLVYRDGLLHSFVTQTWSHLMKPKSIKA